MKQQAQKKRSAFTLIEIMVATVIMVVLVGLVIQITSEVLKVWNRTSGKLSANAEARIALDLITQDLETAVIRNNRKQWLRVESSGAAVGPLGNNTVALKLFSPALDRDASLPGDICAIGYQLDYGPAYQSSVDDVYALYRKIVEPRTTFDSVLGSSDDAQQDALVDGEWLDIVDNPERNNYLAGNILEFKILLYVDDGTGEALLLNADSDLELSGVDYAYGENPENVDATATIIDDRLIYAEIILTAISDEGIRVMQRFNEGGPFEEYSTADDIARLHAETFSRRVNFVARPL